ncbi:MAG: MOSC domain-containing protein [Desulfofustis sp.]|nr:MOSC domain-containing protein [Desulfofustis sp.]
MATVEAVCTSDKKGIVKKERDRVILKANWGIEGDAHAGDWHRQISLLASESIELVREQLPTLKKGAFAENIITRGIDLEKIGIGRKIQIGASAVLEITQIGKECHNSGCAIKKATGDCIMPREGLFAKVIEGGSVGPGDDIVAL